MNDRPQSSATPLVVALVALALGLPCIGVLLLAVGLFFFRASAVPAPIVPQPVPPAVAQSLPAPASPRSASSQDDKQKTVSLLGAKGPFIENVGGEVEVIGADVADELEFPNTANPQSRRILPTGTKVVRVWLELSKSPPDKITLAVFNDAGRVPLSIATNETTDGLSGKVSVANRCTAQETFPDGAYQARLKVGDQEFLHINWHIGKPAE